MKTGNHHLPDLTDCRLEARILPASFLESTFFEPPAFSAADPELGGFGASTAGNVNIAETAVFLEPTSAATYYGFGSNPFGLGLSPLDGVVSAYSQNTALSNIIGSGSSLPSATLSPNNLASIPLGAMTTVQTGAPATPVLTPPTVTPPVSILRNYGATFSGGFNFGINSTNNYGMGPNVLGTLIASRTGYSEGSVRARIPGVPENPNVPGPGVGADRQQNPGAGFPGAINTRPGAGAPAMPAAPFFPQPSGENRPGTGTGTGATPNPNSPDRPAPPPAPSTPNEREGPPPAQEPRNPGETAAWMEPPGGWVVWSMTSEASLF